MTVLAPPVEGEILFNPFDPDFRANPRPWFDRLRTYAPVWESPVGGVILSRYDDVSWTLRSPDFSRNIEANATPRNDPVSIRRRERAHGRAGTILNLDPPDHTRLRRLISKAFTPSAIQRLRGSIEAQVDAVLDVAAERGSLELVDDLAFPVPFQVISDLLAIPNERSVDMREWSQALTEALEPTTTLETLDAADQAIAKMGPYLNEVIDARRKNLGDDVLSALIAAEEEGDRMTPEELQAFTVLLYVAGHETTVNLIGNGMLALLAHPDELERWRRDPTLDQCAVDELLRYDGPVQQTVRVPTVPVTYQVDGHDLVVEPGTVVMTLLGSANHDPAMFDEPGRLQLDRPNSNRHLAFSAGIHYCLGASVARLEAEVILTRLIRRFDSIELTSQPVFRDRVTIRGVDRMDLAVS